MSLFQNKNALGQLTLGVLFLIYLVIGCQIPSSLANLIDTWFGKSIVVGIVLFLFIIGHPLLGVLGIFVAYHLIIQSSIVTGSYGVQHYIATENTKYENMNQLNEQQQYPYSLEQEVIKKMAPLSYEPENPHSKNNNFYPVVNDLHDASPIDISASSSSSSLLPSSSSSSSFSLSSTTDTLQTILLPTITRSNVE